MEILNAAGLSYQELNAIIHRLLAEGKKEIYVKNALGQRFVGCGLKGKSRLVVEGVPGNNLGSYLDGPWIEVKGNGQDGIGNTMNSGTIVVHGNAGDIVGYAMRGGEIYVRGNVGYRSGIHMKAYGERQPVLVVGGKAGSFLGEYMAGGVIIVLGYGIPEYLCPVGDYVGTGMHGGTIYIRGRLEKNRLAREAMAAELEAEDWDLLRKYVTKFNHLFEVEVPVEGSCWTKLKPRSSRPYGALYAHR